MNVHVRASLLRGITSGLQQDASRTPRPVVLHLSADYCDPTRPPQTTRAVARLIDTAPGCEHVVFSLHRVTQPWRERFTDCGLVDGRRVFAFRYCAPPFGLGMLPVMARLARVVLAHLERQGIRPQLVHAHRFGFEGIAGWMAAKRLGVPVVFSLRGETDRKVMRWKPLLRPLMRRMAQDAERVFVVSRWFEADFLRWTGADADKLRPLPNLVRNVKARIEPQRPGRAFLTIAQLDQWRKKGLDRLIPAFAAVARENPALSLDIVGSGGEPSLRAVRALIERHGMTDRVRLLGAMPNRQLIASLPHYLAYVMPSHAETFGMAYLEALFAGVPVLWSRDTGIDGWLDGIDVGVRVDPRSVPAIADGLRSLLADNAAVRARVAAAAPGLFERFDPEGVGALYRRELEALLPMRALRNSVR